MDNPQAFPSVIKQQTEYGDEYDVVQGGMTLRDYFAGQALIGTLSAMKTTNGKTEEEMIKDFTGLSYVIADAMLKERSK